ncbi:MAG: hypothetical protein N4A71_23995 [Carboxylicivirga sp.]|jgi:hypothetical protein|nr:hypothetical protein [Carboxylicivirga sp.]
MKIILEKIYLVLVFCGIIIFQSCNQSDDAFEVPITFSSQIVKAGDIFEISGGGFGKDPELVKVSINGKDQVIESITDNKIKVQLAKKTFSGKVKVLVSGINGNNIEKESEEVINYHPTYRVENLFKKGGRSVAVNQQGDIYLFTNNANLIMVPAGTTNPQILNGEDVDFSDLLVHSNGKVYAITYVYSSIFEVTDGVSTIYGSKETTPKRYYEDKIGSFSRMVEAPDGELLIVMEHEDKTAASIFRYDVNSKETKLLYNDIVDAQLPYYDSNSRLNIIGQDYDTGENNQLYQIEDDEIKVVMTYTDLEKKVQNRWTTAVDHPGIGTILLQRDQGLFLMDNEYSLSEIELDKEEQGDYFDFYMTPDMDLVIVQNKEDAFVKKLVID